MAEETKVVEAKTAKEGTENATVQTQKEAPASASEVDYEALLAQKDAEIAQVRTEKDNYRKGLLKAKGKLPEDVDLDSSTPEGMDALIDRKVQEKFLSTKEAQLHAEKEATLKAVLKRNKELEVALKNRGQISTTSGAGSNEDKAEVKTDKVLSADQINSLKAKGWDDKKIEAFKKNLNKVNEMPR